MRTFVMLFGLIFIALPSLGIWYWWKLNNFAHTPGHIEGFVEITIEKGNNAKTIGEKLKQVGLVSDSTYFYHYARFVAHKATRLQAGYYVIEGTSTPAEIVDQLLEGHEREYKFVIPEGSNQQEIAQIIADAGIATKEQLLNEMRNARLLAECGLVKGADRIEGYLFPDTYQFPKGAPTYKILWQLCQRMKLQIEDASIQARMKEKGWDLHQLLTAASIIEKETGVPEERPLVSSVLHNRLRIGMRLQMDPTVAYGLNKDAKRLTRKDLQTPHVYNTYLNYGLPPGPIASPGLESIKAALWPAESDYLYYVSRKDGSHEFCATYKCHDKAVKRWQLGLRVR